jgi:excisionase family DNA binding protein
MKPTTNRPTTNRRVAGALLTKPEAAAALNVTGRFVERLIAERRVRFVKLGRHVRIPRRIHRRPLVGATMTRADRN